MAKEGLLPAIYSLAKNASAHGKLKIEVQDFGVTHNFDTTTEVTIFRIIQELVTNIIKHSQAAEANISLTQHKMILSIIVEDKGVGFNPQLNDTKKGMGLSSIEKRIEHLNGSLEIDSTPGKGTTVIIELPLD
jgi:signal transduction histidine kinase